MEVKASPCESPDFLASLRLVTPGLSTLESFRRATRSASPKPELATFLLQNRVVGPRTNSAQSVPFLRLTLRRSIGVATLFCGPRERRSPALTFPELKALTRVLRTGKSLDDSSFEHQWKHFNATT